MRDLLELSDQVKIIFLAIDLIKARLLLIELIMLCAPLILLFEVCKDTRVM